MIAFSGTLTDQQVSDIQAGQARWMDAGLSTARCDRQHAVAAVDAAYVAAGLEPAPLKIWMGSPLGGVFASAVIRHHLTPGQLGDQLRDQLGGQLDPWWEAYWLEFYAQALKVAGQQASGRLDALGAAVAEIGWWWPMRGAVVMTERPTALNRDQQGRLHGEAGPALAYADGYTGFWWHGVRVPADLVEGDGWEPQRILAERNTEIRRCAIEKRGWDRFVADADLAQVGRTVPDPGNPGGELALYDVPAAIYDEPVKVLLARNGTRERDGSYRRFGLTVPASITDPIAAAAWTYDLNPSDYKQLARRS